MSRLFLLSVLNFSVFVALFFYAIRKPAKTFIAERHVTLRDELAKVRDQLRTAQERYEEFSAKLKAIDVEISNIRDISQKESTALGARIVSSAQQTAGSILAESKTRASSLAGELRTQLRSELGLRIVSRAQELIHERLTGDDRARIRKEFSERVGSAS